MGGINAGLENIKDQDYDYVLLMNDDTHILPNDFDWLTKLKNVLDADPDVAAVGPSSNVVAGWQNMRHTTYAKLDVKFLIGFCVLVRRSALDAIGWLDEGLPGGDDFDMSIEFRNRGWKLVACRDSFVFHHGFKTGERIHGGAGDKGGWNSPEMSDATNKAIIRKHGFKAWVETVRNDAKPYGVYKEEYGDESCFVPILNGRILDIGCGATKVCDDAIGVDTVPKGENTPNNTVSSADIVASGDNLHMMEDESVDTIVSRHNVEHYSNVLKTLREWYRVLKPGGNLGISTPDDSRLTGMRLDPTHKHSFTREALTEMVETVGFEVEDVGNTANQWGFYMICRKPRLLEVA